MAERQERFHSVVDLLDAFFGGSWTGESVNQLSRDEMYSLAEDVNSFYSEFRLPHRGDQEYRCYSGGATFSQSGPPASTNQPTAVGPIPLSSIPIFARSAVLYADEIVVNCPLDAWVYRYRDFRMPGPYWSYHRTMAITSLHTFGEYQPGFWGAEEAEIGSDYHELWRRSISGPRLSDRVGFCLYHTCDTGDDEKNRSGLKFVATR